MYWRIIRINGDGSLRMIYAGTSAHANDDQDDDTFAKVGQPFNNTYGDAKYEGYMYGPADTAASTSAFQAQSNIVSSDIKIALESWYEKNLLDSYDEYISKNAIFCNDRSIPGIDVTGWSDDTGLGYGTNNTGYGAMSRFALYTNGLTSKTNINPTFKCPQENDKFTSPESTKGNRALMHPIGLITADEIVAAGSGKFYTNSSYYLKRVLSYWSLSPSVFFGNTHSGIFYVCQMGRLNVSGSLTENAVAPVINLTPEYAKTLVGSGTIDDFYRDPNA